MRQVAHSTAWVRLLLPCAVTVDGMATMSAIAEQVREWAAGCRFPARLRVFAPGPSAECGVETVWCDARPAERLAAAVGCALAMPEATVVAMLEADCLSEPSVREAMDLAVALAAPVRCVVLGETTDPPAGWSAEVGPCWIPARALSFAKNTASWATAAPVHLPALRQWVASTQNFAWLLAHEPRILVGDRTVGWSSIRPNGSLLVALAAAGREGLRPLLTVSGGDIGGWWAQLAAIGSRPTPLCLRVVGPGPALGWWRSLPGWWVCAPSALHDRAVLSRALGSRDHVAILVEADTEMPPGDADHEPGGGLWTHADDAAAVVLVGPGSAQPALLQARAALQRIGIAAATWECTSVHPLALPTDARPVVAVEGDLAGFADAVRAERGPQVGTVARTSCVTTAAAEIAAVVRNLLAERGSPAG